MDTSLKSREFVLFVIIVTLIVVSSEGRPFPQMSSMGRKAKRELRLLELINYVRNCECHVERSMLGGRLERVSPQGPDSHHH